MQTYYSKAGHDSLIYSHLSSADDLASDLSHTQLDRFKDATVLMPGIATSLAASGGTFSAAKIIIVIWYGRALCFMDIHLFQLRVHPCPDTKSKSPSD